MALRDAELEEIINKVIPEILKRLKELEEDSHAHVIEPNIVDVKRGEDGVLEYDISSD